jgi:adenylate kinase family enzyme
MRAYEASTRPLADYYRRAGLLVSVSASGSPKAVLERALRDLKKALALGVAGL